MVSKEGPRRLPNIESRKINVFYYSFKTKLKIIILKQFMSGAGLYRKAFLMDWSAFHEGVWDRTRSISVTSV